MRSDLGALKKKNIQRDFSSVGTGGEALLTGVLDLVLDPFVLLLFVCTAVLADAQRRGGALATLDNAISAFVMVWPSSVSTEFHS